MPGSAGDTQAEPPTDVTSIRKQQPAHGWPCADCTRVCWTEDERLLKLHILPTLGRRKVQQIGRADVAQLHASLKTTPVAANRVLCCLRKMFNMAEVWGFRDDGTNPCRVVRTQSGERAKIGVLT